jgi:hypothetical protein
MKARDADQAWGMVALWLVTASTVLLLQSWLFETNFLLSLASIPLAMILGLGLFLVLLSRRAWKAALTFIAATILIACLPLNALGHQAWTRLSFAQHRDTYGEIVSQGPGVPARGKIDGEAYVKDGERTAFPRSSGMPDGWSGVVHDPTNDMPLAGGARMVAFGSNIQSCIRIEQDWYRCWFD